MAWVVGSDETGLVGHGVPVASVALETSEGVVGDLSKGLVIHLAEWNLSELHAEGLWLADESEGSPHSGSEDLHVAVVANGTRDGVVVETRGG